ncbi:hypothetical protein DTX80_08450 [Bacilli bacterium]|nr:hypothetical protein WH51_11185 [Bacilli bacterium VT-13-104]PZD85038.1 hypothetical protein DEJ64_10905 [Bacilli bacterium]PZD85893.1 hypothetical protein DEJ60_11590 [Bacilli bacterium]PZD89470.1 hypothetical protein DEJ66_11545 [Bacilli bacterium]RCO06065.1 hypothetical protein DTX80_08450 [Bacilli bacterium]
MKKSITLLLLTFAFLGLAACSSGDKEVNEIYNKALEAAEEMNSAEVDIEMKQEMSVPQEEDAMVMESQMSGAIITEPLAMHQKGTTSISMGEEMDEPMEMEQELYFVDNEMYSFDSITEEWLKMDDSTIPMDFINTEQMDTSDQLNMFKDYVDNLKYEETDEAYIFQFSPNQEEVKTLAEDLLEGIMPEELTSQLGEEVTDVLENTEMNHLEVEMFIRKDSYQIEKYHVDMDMTMSLEGEEINIKQNMSTVYHNINTIDHIEIPEEIKESAKEVSGF